MPNILALLDHKKSIPLAAFTLAACLLPQTICAQSAAGAKSTTTDDEEIIELSTFEVNTSMDRGYMANNTLGGSRTNTETKDLANSIDILAGELLADMDVQDMMDLTDFAVGVASLGIGDSTGEETSVWNANYMEFRGHKSSTVTRNFMDLNSQADSYNTERIEFSSGPNAILAGMGDAGGGANFSTKKPRTHKNSYTIGYRTDTRGSQRATIGANQVLVRHKLAVRFDAVWNQSNLFRDSYSDQNAWYLAAQWRPFKKTVVNVSYENRRLIRALPRTVFPTDRVSEWSGNKVVASVADSNNVTILDADGTKKTVAIGTEGLARQSGDTYVIENDGSIRNTKNTAVVNAARVYSGGSTYDTYASGQYLDNPVAGYAYPNDRAIAGPSGINDNQWQIFEASIMQQFTNYLQAELSYGHSMNDILQGISSSAELFIDPNDFAGATHVGELYAQNRPRKVARNVHIDHIRGTVALQMRPDRYNKWLGKHQFAIVGEYNERYEIWDETGLTMTRINGNAVTGNYNTSAVYLNVRHYLNPDKDEWSMRNYHDLYTTDVYENDGITAEWLRTNNGGRRTLTKRNTVLGVLQSRLLLDKLILTLGLRKDEIKQQRVILGSIDPDTGLFVRNRRERGLLQDPRSLPLQTPVDDEGNVLQPDAGTSRNFGGVFHAARWLAFGYNYANNISMNSESFAMLGEYIKGAKGVSHDFSMRFEIPKMKTNIKLVYFKTNVEGAVKTMSSISAPRTEIINVENILQDNLVPVNTRGDGTTPVYGSHTTADQDSKGFEATINSTPIRGLTLRLTFASLKSVNSNLAPDIRAYYNKNLEYYKSFDQDWTLKTGTTPLSQRIKELEDKYGLMNMREGLEVFPKSEYSVRLIAKYSFRKGWLKGFTLGSSSRWDSAPVIGFYRDANLIYDRTRPYKGEEVFTISPFATYERKIWKNILWKVQVNVSNLFNNCDPRPAGVINDSTGDNFNWRVYRWTPQADRSISLNTSFSF